MTFIPLYVSIAYVKRIVLVLPPQTPPRDFLRSGEAPDALFIAYLITMLNVFVQRRLSLHK